MQPESITQPDRPLPASYWVEPGRFLAGEYPGRPNSLHMRQRAHALLRFGFDVFIDLTRPDEREPYYSALQEHAAHYGLTVSHQRFAIGDLGLPTVQSMVRILDAIDNALVDGHNVYLHCWAGVGRTGTTVGCYLVRHGRSGEQALAQLARLYGTSLQSQYYRQVPETKEQVDFIRNWGRGDTKGPARLT
jgi:hypothetical protein